MTHERTKPKPSPAFPPSSFGSPRCVNCLVEMPTAAATTNVFSVLTSSKKVLLCESLLAPLYYHHVDQSRYRDVEILYEYSTG
jgi:hypothetical protein